MEHATILLDRSTVLDASPATFECAGCGIEHNSLDRSLPGGWRKVGKDGSSLVCCGDCVEAAAQHVRSADPRPADPVQDDTATPLVVDSAGWATVVDGAKALSWYVYNGCRVRHWSVPGTGAVAVQIMGGDETGQGTRCDDTVLFTVRPPALRELIAHLQAIETSLPPAGVR